MVNICIIFPRFIYDAELSFVRQLVWSLLAIIVPFCRNTEGLSFKSRSIILLSSIFLNLLIDKKLSLLHDLQVIICCDWTELTYQSIIKSFSDGIYTINECVVIKGAVYNAATSFHWLVTYASMPLDNNQSLQLAFSQSIKYTCHRRQLRSPERSI